LRELPSAPCRRKVTRSLWTELGVVRGNELRPESVAGIVLDRRQEQGAVRAGEARSPVFAEDSLPGIVFTFANSRYKATLGIALLAVTLAASCIGLAAQRWATGSATPKIARRSAPLRVEYPVEREPPATSVPTLPEASLKRAAPALRAPTARPHAPSAKTPPPPARAAQAVAVEAATMPLDFTGFDLVTGRAERYAGGISASSGTNTRAVHAAHVERNAPPNRPVGSASRARAVGLPAREWRCPWPRAAEALSVNEQAVVIRAHVLADGAVASAELLSDPGYGFGQVALDCVREQRFPPATDEQGRPVAAKSPPIRVRFVRP
jgi:periplasmic protein TonB